MLGSIYAPGFYCDAGDVMLFKPRGLIMQIVRIGASVTSRPTAAMCSLEPISTAAACTLTASIVGLFGIFLAVIYLPI
jgi:hypothetical protein